MQFDRWRKLLENLTGFRKKQQTSAFRHKYRHRVLQRGGMPFRNPTQRVKGKANVKAAKKLTHIKGYYGKVRRGEIHASP